ncbi:hypothetical protein GQ53DRAFT_815462 [Thozetella sp. PMI_491]|nr:hypothetical protein GQ53DRAFT_815462 [Thozetella sp. PMI_491]
MASGSIASPEAKATGSLNPGSSEAAWERTRRRRQRDSPATRASTSSTAQSDLSVAGIMKHINANREYTVPLIAATVKNLPEFENISQYGISFTNSDALWRLESDRLLAASVGSQPLLFEDDSLGLISVGGYEMIQEAARRVRCALIAAFHENLILMMEHKPSETDVGALRQATLFLQRETEAPSKRIDDEAKMMVTCHALVNYLTATFARLMSRRADDSQWRMTYLAILVRIATKTKIACRDARGYALRSLRLLEASKNRMIAEMHLQMRSANAGPDDDESDEEEGPRTTYYITRLGKRDSRLRDIKPSEMDAIEFYTMTIGSVRHDIYMVLEMALENLLESNRPGIPIEVFELSTMLMRTSFEKSSFTVSQDRRGQISATAGIPALAVADIALDNLQSTINAVEERLSKVQTKPPVDAGEARAHACVRWHKIEEPSTPVEKHLELSNARDIVSIIVAAIFTFPAFGTVLDGDNSLGNLLYQVPNPALVSTPAYTVLFSIATRAYENGQSRVSSLGAVNSISKSLLLRQGLLESTGSVDSSEKGHPSWIARELEEKLRLVEPRRKVLKELNEEIESSWQFDDDSVTIGCWKYAGTVALICFALVGGGLAVGFTVGTGIEGVDPFNITVFCWAFAAFILVVAKSARVRDWPWQDFLRGRVVCRSLSELCVVTGKDQQDVLAWLLQNENSTVLQTKGPYNKLFQRRGDWGFSVDCMIELGTMMLSGIVVLEVQTQVGPALVCLDARPGVAYRAFTHSNLATNKGWNLACIEPPPKENSKAIATLLPLNLGWSSVLGVYNVPSRLFR